MTGLSAMASTNLVPYLRSFHAYDGDGFEVAGFPFIFRKVGGYAFIHRFSLGLLLADSAIGLFASVAFGFAAVALFRYARRNSQGFPVVIPADENAKAK